MVLIKALINHSDVNKCFVCPVNAASLFGSLNEEKPHPE